MADVLGALQGAQDTYLNVLIGIMRYLVPVLSAFLLFRCMKPLLTFRREPEIWAWLHFADGSRKAITHWENVIGSQKRCDIRLDCPTVNRIHGVLTRYDDGSWTLSNTDNSVILVEGKRVDVHVLRPRELIDIGGVEMVLEPISEQQEKRLAQLRTKASSFMTSMANVLLLTVLQMLCLLAFLLGGKPENAQSILLGFGGIMVCQWVLLLFYVCIHRTSFEVETIAFFLSTMGMAAIATICPEEALKQLVAMVLGLLTFLLLGWSLRKLDRVKKFRYVAGVAGIAFLVITLLFGQEYYGAKNWLVIGPLSIQPSELSKICFVYMGASAMDVLMQKKNLLLFIGYSVLICGCLALMNDFGTALIFFCAFLVTAYLRSGNVGTLALAITALVFAGVVALKIAPHALRRFTIWQHIWEDPLNAGYQQTRALMCMAAGGLLGLGPGQGWMRNVFAADSDVVVATLTEEWGLIMVLLMILSIGALAIFAVRSASVERSCFYTISSCTAASILLVQVMLNALGTVDVVPLTGVTFPFLSNGGSSMICAWGLIAFIKAADTRQNASFAVMLRKEGDTEDE